MNRQASAEGARTLHNGKDKQTEEEFVSFLGDLGGGVKKQNQNWEEDATHKIFGRWITPKKYACMFTLTP